jgi:multiple sugar transport system permease protein
VVAITPAAVLLGLFFVFPALWSVYVSMTSLSLTDITALSPEFVGMDNYRRLWNNPDFGKFVRNTLTFTLGAAVVGETTGGFLIAILLNKAQRQGYRLAPVAFGVVILAGICPPTLSGTIWGGIFDYRNGTLNLVLDRLHLGEIDMLGDYPMLAVTIAESWRGLAFAMIIFYAALQTIPDHVYEAARIDGGSRMSQFLEITLPAMRHTVALVLLMTTIMTIGSFLTILVMTNGDPAYQTETISLNAYHTAFQFFDIGYGAAISVVMLLITAAFALIYGLLTGRQR